MDIREGDLVEICNDEDGFFGSYFEARVIRKMKKGDKFEVEYLTLLKDENANKRLTEIVEAERVRPTPPLILEIFDFNVSERVDAYDLDGWWVGRITGRVDDDTYSVYFDSSGDELPYHVSKLRVHQEFDNGEWIRLRRPS